MNKVFSVLKEMFLILSFVVLSLAMVIAFAGGRSTDVQVAELFIAVAVVAFVGLFLMHAANDVAKKIGTGITVAVMVMMLSYGIYTMSESTTGLLFLIAAIFYALYYIFLFVGKIAVKDASLKGINEVNIAKLERWHELLEKGIITQAEYDEQRVIILGLKKEIKK